MFKARADADVVIENFRPGTFERWGLGYDVLREHQPEARDRAVDGLRPDRPVQPARGYGTVAECDRGASLTSPASPTAADAAAVPARRLDRGATSPRWRRCSPLYWREQGGGGRGPGDRRRASTSRCSA